MNILESVQLEAIHIITGLRRGTSHAILYNESGLIPLAKRRHLHQNIHFFKILNNQCPPHVIDSIQPFINNNTAHYPLRHSRLFDVPLTRTRQYSTSFFPKLMTEWNDPSCLFPSLTSIYAIKKTFLSQPVINPLLQCSDIFKYKGNRKINIILCQLRNSASNLNFDLFNSHLNDNPACTCGYPVEDPTHFFFHCPFYTIQRQLLLNSLSALNDSLPLTIDTFLKGSYTLDANMNKSILDMVQRFIIDTGRLL